MTSQRPERRREAVVPSPVVRAHGLLRLRGRGRSRSGWLTAWACARRHRHDSRRRRRSPRRRHACSRVNACRSLCGLESNQVVVGQRLHQCPVPWERDDEVRWWQRGVKKESDAASDALFAQQRRERHQVVVVHPDQVVIVDHRGEQSRESCDSRAGTRGRCRVGSRPGRGGSAAAATAFGWRTRCSRRRTQTGRDRR